jgi:hypothetical protein
MSGFLKTLSHGTQAVSFVLGGIVLTGACAAFLTTRDAAAITQWSFDVLGVGFLGLLATLIFIAAFALVRMKMYAPRMLRQGFGTRQGCASRYGYWLEVGVQAANGVSTLALTFTLLGISLGIGGLAGQELTPETVQPVIRDLTADFSLAFMTTVVGLPVSAALRAALMITHEKNNTLGSVS